MLEELETEEITKEGAPKAALDLIAKLLPEEGITEKNIIYIGGRPLFEEEIEYAWIVNGVLNGNPEAIAKALELVGRKGEKIDIKELRGKVIDLRIEEYKRTILEIKRAL